ncbi:MAG: glycerophosphodiester phosphodiesterase [Thermoleophilia bacterium]|nr:glycerophosphodiester phosphodiesterase [Thermoleophilia bacterium]
MTFTRIGHKGADKLVPGNTVASFEKAVEIGVDVIELDVLWLESGHPDIPLDQRTPLVVAHDWPTAAAKEELTLYDALEAFTRPPLDKVIINLDIKLPGREAEIVEAARGHGIAGRIAVSTMEVSTVKAIGELAPEVSLGWTVPKVTRDWLSKPFWMKPALLVGLASVRRRMPRLVRQGIAELGVEIDAIWAFYGVVTPALVKETRAAGVKLNVWTIDDRELIDKMLALGVDGICSNDPRLF